MEYKHKKSFAYVIIAIAVFALVSLFAGQSIKDNADKSEEDSGMEEKEYKLSQPVKSGCISVEEAISERRSIREYSKTKLSEKDLSQLLWAAQGISDEKEGLRTAPSAGALYPLEIYVAVGMVEEFSEGLYKYNPLNHSLTLKQTGDIREDLYNASLKQSSIKEAAVVIIYCASFERTASKYGNRAVQYVFIEVGHSAQNVYLEAAALNLGTVAIGAFEDKKVKSILKFPEEEDPVYIMPVGKKLSF